MMRALRQFHCVVATRTLPRTVGIRIKRGSSWRRSFNAISALTEGDGEATEKELKQRYIKLAKTVHPDANPDDPEAQNKFVALAKAYEELLQALTHGGGLSSAMPQRHKPRWDEMQQRYRKARAKYRTDDDSATRRSTRVQNDEEDWANRAAWYYANVSSEFMATEARKEVQSMKTATGQSATAANSSGAPPLPNPNPIPADSILTGVAL